MIGYNIMQYAIITSDLSSMHDIELYHNIAHGDLHDVSLSCATKHADCKTRQCGTKKAHVAE